MPRNRLCHIHAIPQGDKQRFVSARERVRELKAPPHPTALLASQILTTAYARCKRYSIIMDVVGMSMDWFHDLCIPLGCNGISGVTIRYPYY
jgi:hypothetical protein